MAVSTCKGVIWYLSCLFAVFITSCLENVRADLHLPEVLKTRLANELLIRPPARWDSLVDGLSGAAGLPIVSFLPETDSVSPRSSKVLDVLKLTAQDAGGVWGEMEGRLYFAPDFLNFKSPRHLPFRGSSVDPAVLFAAFVGSLQESQIEVLAAGKTLHSGDLTAKQRSYVEQSVETGSVLNSEMKAFLLGGDVKCSLIEHTTLYWRGQPISLVDGNLNTIQWRGSSAYDWARGTAGRPIREMVTQARALWKDMQPVSVKECRNDTLGEFLRNAGFAGDASTFFVSRRVQNVSLVISAGEWPAAELMTLVQLATHTELRQVADVTFLERTAASRDNIRIRAEINQSHQEWANLRRVAMSLAAVSAGDTKPFPKQVLLDPQLIPYERLTEGQRSFALRCANVQALYPPHEITQRAGELECYPHLLFCWNFTTFAPYKRSFERVYSFPQSYAWLKVRNLWGQAEAHVEAR